MWTKRKGNIDLVDSKIVTRDFIVAEGSTLSYNFLGEKNNPFERSIKVPVFYIFKVHRNHSLRVLSSSTSHVDIYPVKELRKNKPRMPGEVYKDKMDFDLATFLFLPFDIELGKSPWRKFSIEEGFIPERDGSHAEGLLPKRSASLLYAKHGPSIHGQDSFYRVAEVMPSQITNHFFVWLREGKEIYSHNKTFDSELEGNVKVPLERARELTWEVMSLLEKRYGAKLIHENYKRYWQDVERGSRV